MKTKKYLASVIAISALFVVFAMRFANAWTEPTGAPPSQSIGAPINTGGNAQYKSGASGFGGVLRGYSNAYFDGNVGIGTTSPSYKLDVKGNVMNSNPSQGYLGLTGDLPGYSNNTYPTLKTNGSYIYFSAAGAYVGYIGNTNRTLGIGRIEDFDNSGYYVDPNNTSRLNYGVYDNVYSYGWIQSGSSMYSPIYYDYNSSSYYVDPASTSVLNSVCAGGSCSDYLTHDGSYLRTQGDFRVTNTFYNDGTAYSQVFYDSNNGNYYVDPNGTSVMNSICAGGSCNDYLTNDGSYLRTQGDFRVTGTLYNDGNTYANNFYINSIGKWVSDINAPWEKVTKTYTLSASDCNGAFTNWHTQGIYLPRYATGVTLAVQAGAGTWIQLGAYNPNWTRIGYAGTNCRPDGAWSAWCGWGNQNPGNHVLQPGLPSGSNYLSAQIIGYCHYGATHTANVTVEYWRPKSSVYGVSYTEPQ